MTEVSHTETPVAEPVRSKRLQFRLMHLVELVVIAAIVLRFPVLLGLLGVAIFLVICVMPPFLYVRWIDSWFMRDDDTNPPVLYLLAVGLFASMAIGVIFASSVAFVVVGVIRMVHA